MTNTTNPIRMTALEAGDRFIDPEGNEKRVSNTRMIDERRTRLTTRDGLVRIVTDDDIVLLIAPNCHPGHIRDCGV